MEEKQCECGTTITENAGISYCSVCDKETKVECDHTREEQPWMENGTQHGTVQICTKCGDY